ncbi:4-alpha-glucanotransferase [Salinibacter sp. 10B]|nr:4-alpha-glucanotransferase [Salinibacter sp. 10B]PQJ36381.1 4-alpha-glucanotransferase [Salinibacter sp. 10B]
MFHLRSLPFDQPTASVDSQRVSGILLHITSLPSAYGIGDLGPAAYRFADFLTRTHQKLWQVLPLGPVGAGASPYSSTSTFAGNPLLISPEPLVEYGLLTEEDLAPLAELPDGHVDYERVRTRKRAVLRTAYERYETGRSVVSDTDLAQFRADQASWLDDYALYAALKDAYDEAPWMQWPDPLSRRDPEALEQARETHADAIRMHVFWQYLFHRQWTALQSYCHARDIRLFGDIPIYVARDSADVWAHQELFHLDDDGRPTVVAGVPPDYFSPEGQRWGNPLYRWDKMEANDYRWWKERLRRTLERVDLVRLDHFRGFDAYWEIPAEAETAVNGEWREGPGMPFFEEVEEELGTLPVVAEDLGVITDSVEALREECGFPGMAVLQFAFEDDPTNEFLPHNYRRNLVAYPGTHDNNTTMGWWADDLTSSEAQAFARDYLNLDRVDAGVHEQALRVLMASVADRVVFPMQDLLGLGSDARMNTPGHPNGNWEWRFTPAQVTDRAEELLETLTRIYGRAGDYDA